MKKILLAFGFLLFISGTSMAANPFIEGRPSELGASLSSLSVTPFMQNILAIQKQIHQALTDHIEALKAGHSLSALWALLLLGFGYGIFHILAPGHGKVIVSSYFLGNRAKWGDGAWAALVLAIGHTVTAVVLVVVLALVFGLSQLSVLDKARYAELFGYGLIALIGLWLLNRAVRGGPAHVCCAHNHKPGHHHHHHDHTQPEGSVTKNRQAMGLFAATSLVPCTGSMIILLYTLANGLLWAGALAVLAIALGIWLTIAIIGTVSIFLHRTITQDDKSTSTWRLAIMRSIRIVAALIITATGTLLCYGAWYNVPS